MTSLSAGQDGLEILASTPARIGRAIAGLDDAALRQAPAGRWSIAQILAHLADSEIVIGWRIRQILAASGTALQPFDQNDWARVQRYDEIEAYASLGLFTAVRAAQMRLLRSLTDEELDRYGMHAERGRESIRHLIGLEAGHDLNHLAQIEQLAGERPPFAPAPVKPEVDAGTLEALDVRVGTIRSAAPLAGTDRLAVLTVDFGDHQRPIVAGIRTERPSLAALAGVQALFVVNLPARTIRGQRSEGMLFDVGFADGLRPAFAQPEWPVPNGVRAG